MSLEIVLDKTSESFSPGETISGVVRVTTDEERHCKCNLNYSPIKDLLANK